MSLSLSDWITQAQTRLKAWAANPKRVLNQVGANSLYFGLAGVTLYPIAEAVARGDLAALGMLYSLGAGVGVNLIANAVQYWVDEADAANQLAMSAEGHPELIEALDVVLQKVEAINTAQARLPEADRAWFEQTLRNEVKHVGSTITISGGVNFQAETIDVQGDIAGRDILKSQTETFNATNSAVATHSSVANSPQAASAGERGFAVGQLHGNVQVLHVPSDRQTSITNDLLSINNYGEASPTQIAWSERSITDLSFYMEQYGEGLISELETIKALHELSLTTSPQGGYFTVAGALLFGPIRRSPKGYHTDVQLDDRVANRIKNYLGCNLLNLYQELLRDLQMLVGEVWEVPNERDASGKLRQIHKYPQAALTEVLVNFIIHRDYAINDLAYIVVDRDHLEFVNPGHSVYSSQELMTSVQPLRPKYRRNEIIIEAFSRSKLNQRRGNGLRQVRQLMVENGNIDHDGAPAMNIENDQAANRFRLHLYAIPQSMRFAVPETIVSPERWRELRRSYLGWVLSAARNVPLAGVDPKSLSEDTHVDLDLAAVYTELWTQSIDAEDNLALRPIREIHRLSALAVLNTQKYLALLGDPGSGKSTFVNFVTLCLAGEGVQHPAANLKTLTAPLPADETRAQREQPQPQPQPQSWSHGAVLPVRVVLRDFAARGLPPIGQPVLSDHLWQFIVTELPESLRDCVTALRDELLQQGGLLLLDGLDEVPAADQRREQVKAAVQGFVSMFSRVRVLVTSRTYAYQKQAWKLDGFAEAVLAPFERGQIQLFVQRWYAYIGPTRHLTPEDTQGRAATLNAAIERSPRLSELAARPLLLTLMASLHAWRGGTLPDQREELYADAVQLLLDQWEGQKVRRKPDGQPELIQPSLAEWLNVDREQVRQVLNQLAFDAQREQADLTGTADITQAKLVNELIRISTRPDARPNRLVEYLSERAGLLEPRGVGVFTFPHRTFQEYLAACYLTDHNFPDELVTLVQAEPLRWREVALLAGAKASHGTAAAVWLLADALCDKEFSPELARDVRRIEPYFWAVLIAAQVLIENKTLTHISERNQVKLERIRQWLTFTITRGLLPPLDRVAAGRALGPIGDPRDFDELIEIPAGKFWLGEETSRHSFIDNTPLHEIDLPLYGIGKYPVTVRQWRLFVEATGHQGDPRTLTDPDNHPARWVSWLDARAYCQWLTAEWHTSHRISTAEVVRLPTEAEWEKAAQGTDRRAWPWGNEIDQNGANTCELGAGTTSAVGCFPSGASPYGCLDMAGNVWEWTQSKSAGYPYNADDGREDVNERDAGRVLRGGSWNFDQDGARCACRFNGHPDDRYVYFGFRCVVSAGSRF